MIKQRVRQAPSAGGLLTKNTAKLRTPKRTGKFQNEKQNSTKSNKNITSELKNLAEKIKIAKGLNDEVIEDNISGELKAAMNELSFEGKKLAEQLKSIQSGNDEAEKKRVDNLEKTISDLKLELDAAKTASLLAHPPPLPLVESQIQVDIANDLIKSLKSENTGLRSQLKESQDLIVKLKSALQTQESTISNQTGQISELKLSNSKSQQNFENEEELRLKLKKELSKKTAELDRFMARVRRLENQQKLLGKGTDELTHVQAALARASAENLAANDEIARLRLEITQNSSNVDVSIKEKVRLESELAKLGPKLRAFEEQDKVIRVLEARLQEQTVHSDQLRARLESLDHGKLAKISDLEHQLASIEVELARKKRIGLDNELKLEKSQNDLNLLKTLSNKEKIEAQEVAGKIREENIGLSEKLEATTMKFEDLQARFNSLQEDIVKKDSKINKLTAESATNAAELQTVQQLATKSSEQLQNGEIECRVLKETLNQQKYKSSNLPALGNKMMVLENHAWLTTRRAAACDVIWFNG